MKNTLLLLILIPFIAFGCASVDVAQKAPASDPYADYIYQYSVIDALLAGVYDGHLSLAELKQRGDFGIGTFNKLDGELLLLDGVVYKLGYDGQITEAPDAENTPLAFVKFFKPGSQIILEGDNLTLKDVMAHLEQQLNGNSLYAIKISGEFKQMHARSVRAAEKPYPPLAKYTAEGGQYVFNFEDTEGVCVGFIMPPYVARTNVPGVHLHYLSDDHQDGGHVFDFTANRLLIEIDEADGLIVQRNTDAGFNTADLHSDRNTELHKVETN